MSAGTTHRVAIISCVLVVISSYVLFEISARLILPSRISVIQELDASINYMRTNDIKVDQFIDNYSVFNKSGTGTRIDSVLGWDRMNDHLIHCTADQCTDPFRILVVGDSVTAGFGVEPEEHYLSLIARSEFSHDVHIINAAVDGFGIDQMALKAEQVLNEFEADVVIVAYIDNDLIRTGTELLWGKTRPTFEVTDEGLRYVSPKSLAEILEDYQRSLNYYYFGVWYVKHVFINRRYYARILYTGYLEDFMAWVVSRFETLGLDKGARVVFLRLPQAFDFYGRETTIRAFADITDESSRTGRVDIVDIEACVRDFINEKGFDFSKVMSLHPPAIGHEAYATCLTPEIRKLLP